LSPLRFPFSSSVRALLSHLLFGSAVQHVIAGCSFRVLDRGIALERHYFPASRHGLPSVSILLAIESSLAYTAERDAASRSNQSLERTADRREDLLSMTSILKPEAQPALVSGRSALSR
jgi:hypothetical protein